MDAKMIVGWIVGIAARGIAWVFAAKLGQDAASSQVNAQAAAEALGALVLVAVSVYSSLKGRKTLLNADPPE
jgi:hypothetical protein